MLPSSDLPCLLQRYHVLSCVVTVLFLFLNLHLHCLLQRRQVLTCTAHANATISCTAWCYHLFTALLFATMSSTACSSATICSPASFAAVLPSAFVFACCSAVMASHAKLASSLAFLQCSHLLAGAVFSIATIALLAAALSYAALHRLL